jgi:hypothetical protein
LAEDQRNDVADTLSMLHAELERGEAPSPAVEALIRQANEQLVEAKRSRREAPRPPGPAELPPVAVMRRPSPMRSHVVPTTALSPTAAGSQYTMRQSSMVLGVVALVMLSLIGVGTYVLLRPPQEDQVEARTPSPGPVAAAKRSSPAPARAADSKAGLPDPSLTPGERTATPQANSSIPETTAAQVLAAYDVSNDPKRTVVCRLIPASLGGTANAKNLFPVTPWFAGLKTRLDKYLTDQVKAGKITVQQAEKELKSNWIQAVHAHNIRNYGANDAAKAREMDDKLRW